MYLDRAATGAAAAERVAHRMRNVIGRKGRVTIMFASAPSQREFLATLARMDHIDWSRVVALQMDEYVSLPGSRQTLARFLEEHLYEVVRPGVMHTLLAVGEDATHARLRYIEILTHSPVDIVCAGIGENGHLAFNDPPANFDDPELVRLAALDARSREQQVHDAQFESLAQVPTHALTVTVTALMQTNYLSCVVPGRAKSEAVRTTLLEPVSPMCPASILRSHRDAVLYLDEAAAASLRGGSVFAGGPADARDERGTTRL
ncbi:MAG TPA: 6-phosphogluconolactonase [bacterium]|nr:6-phosphogluconolactonase [bacterium]